MSHGTRITGHALLLLTTHYSPSRRLNRPAVHPPNTTVQPLFSTVPCKLLNILANLMVKSFMFASQPNHISSRPRPLHPLASNNCHPACPERSRRERSEGSAFLPLVARRRSQPAFAPVTPFVATDTAASQLTENPATLSPVFATLTRRVKPNPFVCHSYKKHPGDGAHSSNQNPAALLAPNHKSLVSASVPSLPPVTSHQSLSPLQSALTQNTPVTPLESALPKHST
jgi:hypothetical protein